MKLGLIGDIHRDTYALHRAVHTLKLKGAEWTCCVGDIGIGFGDRKDFVDALNSSGLSATILGNHDEQNSNGYNDYWEDDGIKVAQLRRSVPVNMNGVCILPIGGGESHDRAYRLEYISWWPGESVSAKDIEKAMDVLDTQVPDVVITHTLPYSFIMGPYQESGSKIQPFHTFGHSEHMLDVLFEYMCDNDKLPKYWIGGHWHKNVHSVYRNVEFHVLDRVDTYLRESAKGGILLIDTETWKYSYPKTSCMSVREILNEQEFV